MRLTQKQETFCLKYFELGNASEAARIALYSPKTAAVMGRENLLKPKIQQRIDALRQKVEDASVANVLERKQVLTEITRVRHNDILDISPDERSVKIKPKALESAAVASVQTEQVSYEKMPVTVTKITLVDKVKAIDLLNKMDGAYAPEKHTHLGIILTKELTDEELLAIATKGDNTNRSCKRITEEADSS